MRREYNDSMIDLFFIEIKTSGQNDIVDITGEIKERIRASRISDGSVLLFVFGSTAALTTIEYEPGLIQDFPELMEKLVPENDAYSHDETWHDGNGHSHLRATLIGPSLTIPIADRKPLLGTWQQVVFLEFDNRPRERRIVMQVTGEGNPDD